MNNMPDGAFAETERQFLSLLERAAGSVVVRVWLHTMPGLPRGEEVNHRIGERYGTLDDLLSRRIDGVIVTGTEPVAGMLLQEPYWPSLAALIAWAERSTFTTVLSCLAAHAALLLLDGIDRVPLAKKCSGVFVHDAESEHSLVRGMNGPIYVPHSRLNDVPQDLLPPEYSNLLIASDVSWTLLTREHQDCLLVLVQGHPEYSTTSLLREYRRDLLRYVQGARSTPPPIPVNYVDEEAEALLRQFAAECEAGRERPDYLERFPFDQVSARLLDTWGRDGERLYSNWLAEILRRKSPGRSLGVRPGPPPLPADEREMRSVGA